MQNNYLNRRTLIGFAIALAILGALAVYSFVNTQRMVSSSQWVAHTYEVLHHSQRLLAVAVNLEIGQRSYAMLGAEDFLEPYHKANQEIYAQYDILKKMVRD